MGLTVKFRRLHPNARTPTRGTEHAAGWDLYALEDTIAGPGQRSWLPTGIAVEVPVGYVAHVCPRSSSFGMRTVTHFGTIDPDYRGEIRVGFEFSHRVQEVRQGDRIAQLVFSHVPDVAWEEVTELSDTARGDGGFGSTGR